MVCLVNLEKGNKMKKLLITIAMLVMLVGVAGAEVLWDQSDYDPNYSGFWNSESGCAMDWTGATVFAANDIRIWDEITIETITTYYDMLEFGIESATQAYLWIAPKTGPLPIDGVNDPMAQGTLVSVTVTNDSAEGGNAYVVTAAGLSEDLSPGDYWIALTPIFPAGFWGANYNITSLTPWGDSTASWEICAQVNNMVWQNVNPGMDASMKIEGSIRVVPTDNMSWGDTKALFR
jgi:hypothetical protein